MASNIAEIQHKIAEITIKIDEFSTEISDIADAVEAYRGMENVDNKALINEYEKVSIPTFTYKKNELYSKINNLLRSIR